MSALSLPISETFLSIQGEGKLTGVPSFFIRTSGCNLRCRWCDTPYASWNPEGTQRTIDDLVRETLASGARHTVITGGEPMIFEPIASLCAQLQQHAIHITIETAGTVFLNAPFDLMSISPKLSTSTPLEGDERDPAGTWRERHEQRRTNIPALQSLIDAARTPGRDLQLKFVACAPADLAEIDALLAQLTAWTPGDVMLMPEGVTTPDPAATRWIVDACLDRGWRYCRRLHIDLFGNRRGT
ncbi:MAG: 7-carboxy-7-deazaguanine synthase QueE [Phycisphaerales bacterium]|jgi:7-carboxy-7-deazaguanine synthase|nr:7-carboxy-7-deazaguanine synthase QueE [Phycisphaerales bacterium]